MFSCGLWWGHWSHWNQICRAWSSSSWPSTPQCCCHLGYLQVGQYCSPKFSNLSIFEMLEFMHCQNSCNRFFFNWNMKAYPESWTHNTDWPSVFHPAISLSDHESKWINLNVRKIFFTIALDQSRRVAYNSLLSHTLFSYPFLNLEGFLNQISELRGRVRRIKIWRWMWQSSPLFN